jgi:hypothetical protein
LKVFETFKVLLISYVGIFLDAEPEKNGLGRTPRKSQRFFHSTNEGITDAQRGIESIGLAGRPGRWRDFLNRLRYGQSPRKGQKR